MEDEGRVSSVAYSSSGPCSGSAPRMVPAAPVAVSTVSQGPTIPKAGNRRAARPGPASPEVQRILSESGAVGEGGGALPQPEKSWIQKNWYLVVPAVVIFMHAAAGANPEAN